MNGQPVWLASVSRLRPNGRTLYVPEWSPRQMREGERLLREVLAGVGDTSRERLFRMNVTLCMHRAATNEEVQAQAPWFLTARGNGLAGGPVEILSETEAGSQSTRPCHHPGKYIIDSSNPHGWIPADCGSCPPCLARSSCALEQLREGTVNEPEPNV